MAHDVSAMTRAVKRALDFEKRFRERLDREFGTGLGYETVSTKEIRQLIRVGAGWTDATAEEIDAARAEINKLHQQNARPNGRNPVDEELVLMIAENKKKRQAELGTLADLAGDGEGNTGMLPDGIMSMGERGQ